MKLVNSKYNLDIEFEENISNTLVLENKQHMIDVIQNLILQLKGDEGDFVLSAEKNVKFDKVVEFIANPFEIDFNNKKIVTKLFEQLIAVASECVEEYNFINGKIVGTLDDICSKIEYYNVEYNLEYEQSTEVILVGSASTARLATTARAKTTTIKLLEKTLSENVFLLMLQRRF